MGLAREKRLGRAMLAMMLPSLRRGRCGPARGPASAALAPDGAPTLAGPSSLPLAKAILAAERVLRIVPEGTHEWDRFVTPVELAMLFR